MASIPAGSMLRVPAHILRGFLIGLAELVPGVSGGTIALVTGVYEQIIEGASHVVRALKTLLTGPDRLAGAKAHLLRARWSLLIPILVGMGAAIITMAGIMESFVSHHGESARGLFFGLVVASVWVPLRMAGPRPTGRSAWRDWTALVIAAAGAFVLVSLAGGRSVDNPPLPLVALAAAIAICALVVPGVSGSFFLLAVGLYAATLGAVHERNFTYLGVFALGAFFGLASFVQLLRWLLERHRRPTLYAMAGLMLGSLRALWPWQRIVGDAADEAARGSAELAAPYDPVLLPIALGVVGAIIVVALVWLEIRLRSEAVAAKAAERASGE